jgi:CshA-type fibril repeat protein
VDTNIPDQTHTDSTAINIDVSSNFSDTEGQSLSFTATGLPPGLSIDTDGNITGTIDSSASVNGPYTVVITADDGNGGSVTDTFTWNVSNPGPDAQDDNYTTDEDTAITSFVGTNDSDPDGDNLTYAQTSNPTNGTVVFNSDGTFTYTPDADYSGTDTFDYEITDADGSKSTATVTIDVQETNDLPVVDAAIPDQSDIDSESIDMDISGNFSDPEGGALTFTATGLPPGLSIDAVGNITGTLDSSASAGGPYTVVVTAQDIAGGEVTDTFTWTVSNPGPSATDDAFTTDEDTAVSGTVAGNDSDPDGDSLSFAQTSNPSNGSVVFNNDGSFTYTPNADFHGTDTFDYEITDADGSKSTATVTITVDAVNDAPIVTTAVPDQSDLDSDTINLDISGNFSDVEGNDLSFTATGLPPGLMIDTDGNITGTIDSSASQNGPYTVVVTVSDGNGGSVTDTFTWSVANPAPTADDDNFTTDEDTPVSGTVSGIDADADDSVTFAQTSNPSNGTVTFNADGTFEYTPNADFNGTDSFDYEIIDADGSKATATVTITVDAVNDPPVVDTNIPDQTHTDSTAINIDVSSNFSDTEGQSLSFTATGLPPGLSIDTDGNITGTIDNSASQGGPGGDGIYSVTVSADDGNGGTVSTTFTWEVDNPPPVAANDTAATNEDTPINIPVLANDSDPDGDDLSVTSAIAANGTVVIEPDGTVTYTPNPDFNGTDTITYTITDGEGGTSTATVTVTVDPVNDAPVAGTIGAQSDQDADTVSVATAGVFTDVDGDTLTFSASGLPAGLTIDPATGEITGTIDNSASQGGPAGDGIYSVTVTADDGNGGTVTATFSWTVTNPAPVAADDTATTNEDMPVSIPVLANDNDPDGDALSVISAGAVNGTVVIEPDGTVTYTPDPAMAKAGPARPPSRSRLIL